MQWLKLKEGATAHAAVDFSSIKSVAKHWTGQRSELCLGEGCPHCLAHNPKRWRYQARLLIDKVPHQWEFGEQAMNQLKDIPHDTNFAHINITRLGDSRNTRYEISTDEAKQPPRFSYAARAAELSEEILRSKYADRIEED